MERFEGRPGLAAALGERVVRAGREAVAARGRFMVAIPGGSALELLAEGLAGRGEDVSAWHWFWADERCVPRGSGESNVGQAERALFAVLGVGGVVHAPEGGGSVEEMALAYAESVACAFGLGAGEMPKFDLVLLGLGEDGHVASLFPGQAGLEDGGVVLPVRGAPKPPPERITLSLRAINGARRVVVAAAGAGTAAAVGRVFGGGGAGERLPAARLRPEGDGRLEWMLDAEAAAGLPEDVK